MNIINDRELALRFKKGVVSSRERLIYLIIFILIYEAPLTQFFEYVFNDYSKSEYDTYVDLTTMFITIIGTIICYKTNKNGDDREFIERYVGIGFPVNVRMIIFIISISLISAILYALNDRYLKFNLFVSIDVWAFAMSICAMVYFFWRLNSSIKLAASAV